MKTQIMQRGSSILMVVITMSILLIASLSLLKATFFITDFCQARRAAQRKGCLSRGILAYGTTIAKQQYALLVNKKEVIELEIDLSALLPHAIGKLVLSPQADGIHIAAFLQESSSITNQLECKLIQRKDEKLQITGFQI